MAATSRPATWTAAGAGVMALVEELHRAGATVVLVTHDPEIAARAQRRSARWPACCPRSGPAA
jgi:hypothetical protein